MSAACSIATSLAPSPIASRHSLFDFEEVAARTVRTGCRRSRGGAGSLSAIDGSAMSRRPEGPASSFAPPAASSLALSLLAFIIRTIPAFCDGLARQTTTEEQRVASSASAASASGRPKTCDSVRPSMTSSGGREEE